MLAVSHTLKLETKVGAAQYFRLHQLRRWQIKDRNIRKRIVRESTRGVSRVKGGGCVAGYDTGSEYAVRDSKPCRRPNGVAESVLISARVTSATCEGRRCSLCHR